MSSHDRDRPTQTVPEIPRRIRPTNSNPSQHPAVREIHKNAWLKRVIGNEFLKKKFEKHWVIFCVHDDCFPFLEFYPDPKAGASHKPISSINLNSCLHVSPSIIGIDGQDNEYEFVVTLPDCVVRLIAANWEQMLEWCESLNGKLRDMKILSPKDNLYSKLPETSNSDCAIGAHHFIPNRSISNVVTTRDPNSPLPPPPVNTADAGSSTPSLYRIETYSSEIQQPAHVTSQLLGSSSNSSSGAGSQTQNDTIRNNISSSNPTLNPRNIIEAGPCVQLVQTFSTDSIENTVSPAISQEVPCENLVNLSIVSGEDEIIVTTYQQPTVASVISSGVNSSNTSVVRLNFDQPSSTSTLIQTSSTPNSNSLLLNPAAASSKSSVLLPPPPSSKKTKKPSLHCRLQSVSSSPPPSLPVNDSISSSISLSSSSSTPRQQQLLVSNNQPFLFERQNSAPSHVQRSTSEENIYEHLYIPSSVNAIVPSKSSGSQNISSTILNHDNSNNNTSSNLLSNSLQRQGRTEIETIDSSPPPIIPRRNPKRIHRGTTNNSTQRSSSLSRIEHPTSSCAVTNSSGRHNDHNGPRRQSRSRPVDVIRSFEACPEISSVPGSSQNSFSERPLEAMIGVRKGEYRIRSDDTLTTTSANNGCDTSRSNGMTHVPLKEQQVLRLISEINHPHGVRIVLRKKDCINSIAFVDYLGGVWIAGWKQQQNILYYAFHVGDRVVKVAGVTVQNSTEAYRAIKMVSSMQVEFIIRRLPFGRVLVLKRRKEDNGSLGLVCVGNSGEVGEVVKNGLAARSGLPPNCPVTGQVDAQTTCNWFLTEINNRPLSLMARESEVKERLNAVGKEITITLQPSDICKHFKKQLKSMKNFKEYLVV